MEPKSSDEHETQSTQLPILRPSSQHLGRRPSNTPRIGLTTTSGHLSDGEERDSLFGKRKNVPRKLDSEKCQLCRQHKLKCTPQPRLWPQKCDRCLSKGLECSPGEIKRRARRPVMEEEQNDVASDISSAPAMPPNKHKTPRETWGTEDVMNILTVVQLLNGEYEIHHSQRTLLSRIFDPQTSSKGSLHWDSPASSGQRPIPYVSSLHQSLPLLKDKLSLAFKARLGQGGLSSVDRTVLEAALVDLHTDLPQRPIMAGHDAVKSPSQTHLCDLLLAVRSLALEPIPLNQLAGLASDMYSENLMRKFGLYHWSHVEQGFGPEWAKLLGYSVLGSFLFESGEHYREARSYVKIWIHDVVARDGMGVGLAANDLASFPAQSWSLDSLAFLTDEVGLNEKDNQGLSLMHAAILDRRPDIVCQLISRGARVPNRIRGKRFSLLHFAAAVGCQNCYLELRGHPDLAPAEEIRDRDGMLPLHVAALRGHTRVVETILSANHQDVEYVNRETLQSGQTALSLAIAYPETNDTAELLAGYAGVDFVVDRDMNQTALHVAASHKKSFFFRALLSIVPQGLINARNEDGETPLHMLARYGDQETLEAALGVPGVEPDLEAGDGSTPLVNAVMEARAGAVEVLAVRGDVNVAVLQRPLEPPGVSALDYAKQIVERDGIHVEHAKVLRYLRENFVELADDLNDYSASEGLGGGT
ncbi:Putative zn(2)Cys(6) fungal-type DNA-binding domain, ankyrin repeat-containing domain superfamily [Colletotrichum destructivum]|uniref:Zn(2)Cys(6) fungal-type DNA-binding domain, ankyrin repeat-containing domain superfamily n=1 Tax=Colletotrichum destructivum TaxID=34406 RepID=A0AAX4I6D9_9PEZI|nr:Putative zn(2)Cys(6) fungal-type DNA-binding domain, ankyrin repeat-containing domain superfamily [Colletotrichum destructivum]